MNKNKYSVLPLEEACENYMKAVRFGGECLDDKLSDLEHCIFEAALELNYGPDVWEEVNNAL